MPLWPLIFRGRSIAPVGLPKGQAMHGVGYDKDSKRRYRQTKVMCVYDRCCCVLVNDEGQRVAFGSIFQEVQEGLPVVHI